MFRKTFFLRKIIDFNLIKRWWHALCAEQEAPLVVRKLSSSVNRLAYGLTACDLVIGTILILFKFMIYLPCCRMKFTFELTSGSVVLIFNLRLVFVDASLSKTLVKTFFAFWSIIAYRLRSGRSNRLIADKHTVDCIGRHRTQKSFVTLILFRRAKARTDIQYANYRNYRSVYLFRSVVIFSDGRNFFWRNFFLEITLITIIAN